MGGSPQPASISVSPAVLWPELIAQWVEKQEQIFPNFPPPQPPTRKTPFFLSASLIAMVGWGAMVVGVLVTGDRAVQGLLIVGLSGFALGIWGLWHSLKPEQQQWEQQQWRHYQSCLRQWENAQKLLRRSRKRQFRQLLAGKVLSPTAKKAVCPNQCQKTLVTSLKRHCPQLSAYLGWEFAFEEEVFRPALALVDERTGLSLVVVIDLTPAWQKFFNEGNWAIIRVSEEHLKKPTDFGAGLAKAIALID